MAYGLWPGCSSPTHLDLDLDLDLHIPGTRRVGGESSRRWWRSKNSATAAADAGSAPTPLFDD